MSRGSTAALMLWVSIGVLVGEAPALADQATAAPATVESPHDLAARFAEALECARPLKDRTAEVRVLRQWCAVAGVDSSPLLVPGSRRVYLGVSMALGPREPVLTALRRLPELAALSLDGKGALVSGLPESDQVKPMGALASLRMVMKGVDKEVHVTKALSEFLKSLDHEHLHRLRQDGNAGTFQALLESRIYLVKGVVDGFVVLEQDESGTRVNLFPAVPVTTD